MGRLSIWNRLYGIAINAGTLIGVLFCCGCKTSKVSSTTVRSDSTRYNVTVVSTIEPVPTKLTDLVLTTDHLTRLTQLPKGYSLVAPSIEGVDLRVESNGNGELKVVAETPMMSLRKDSTVMDVETHIRDETQTKKEVKSIVLEPWHFFAAMIALGFILMFIENKYFKD